MNRGLKHLCILFTCLSVVIFSSIFVMADENDEDINLPEEFDQLVDEEEAIDEPLSIDANEESDDAVEIIIEEDIIFDAQEEIEEVNNEDVSLPQVISIEIDCRKGIILDRDVVFSPCNGRSANTTGIPNSGDDVPILPGTIKMAVLSFSLQYAFISLIIIVPPSWLYSIMAIELSSVLLFKN